MIKLYSLVDKSFPNKGVKYFFHKAFEVKMLRAS